MLKIDSDVDHADMKTFKKFLPYILVAVVFIVVGWLLINRQQDGDLYSKQFFAMDTIMDFKVWGKDAKPATEAAEAEIDRLEKLLSTNRDSSEVAKLNKNSSGRVSGDTLAVIKLALNVGTRTGGAEDITMYPITRLWGFTTGKYRVPSDGEIKKTLKYVGPKHIKISGNTVTLDPGSEIDLGSVAKGYAADKVIDIMKRYSVSSAVISLGGNIGTYGKKDGTGDWRVGVEDPAHPDQYAGILTVGQKAVTTAGNYQRYFDAGGKRYCHIFDPATGYPASNGLASVTIVSDSGTFSDGIDTPLFVMGLDNAINFWRKSNDFEAVFIDTNGKIYVTEGLKNSFSDCPNGFSVISRKS